MTDFTMKTDADGVATITWDVPGKSMNVMSFDGLRSSRPASMTHWQTTPSKAS